MWQAGKGRFSGLVPAAAAVAFMLVILVGAGVVLLQPPKSSHRPVVLLSPSPDLSPSQAASPSDLPSETATAATSPQAGASPSPAHTPSATTPAPTSHPTSATAHSPSPMPPTPAPSPVACTASQVTLTVSTDHPSYTSGSAYPVKITLKLTNHSSQSCLYYNDGSGTDPGVKVRHNGDTYDSWCSSGPCGVLPNTSGARPQVLAPGAYATQQFSWNQQRSCSNPCTSGQSPSGAYTATATWDNAASATTQFAIA